MMSWVRSSPLLLAFILITIGLFNFLYLIMILSEEILPTLTSLSVLEANIECELMERNTRWDYDGGLQDCVDYYTADNLFMKQLTYHALPLSLCTLFTTICLFGSTLLLYFSEEKNL